MQQAALVLHLPVTPAQRGVETEDCWGWLAASSAENHKLQLQEEILP